MRIAFVGGGNMASALIGGLLAGGGAAASVTVIEPLAAQRAELERRFGIATRESADADPLDCDAIVIAVKPQAMRDVASGLRAHAHDRLVVSVAAGIRLADLSRWLGGHRRLVRCMPNTPALVGAGITGMAAAPGLAQSDRDAATRILASVGQTVWVDDEAHLDAVTAVSGSGPAYVFYFMEAMHRAAVGLGLTDAQARQLTTATFAGAARLAADSAEPPSVLRERVTSKGGTTAAALTVMAEHDVAGHIVEAIGAARRRSVELGDEFGRD
jgi:pyrroline-5-carboxylate reductase